MDVSVFYFAQNADQQTSNSDSDLSSFPELFALSLRHCQTHATDAFKLKSLLKANVDLLNAYVDTKDSDSRQEIRISVSGQPLTLQQYTYDSRPHLRIGYQNLVTEVCDPTTIDAWAYQLMSRLQDPNNQLTKLFGDQVSQQYIDDSIFRAPCHRLDFNHVVFHEGELEFGKIHPFAAGADFSNASAQKINFTDVNLTSAILKDADLDHATFKNTKLAGADFTGASLEWARFENVDLTNANFTNANISGAEFTNSTLCNLRPGDKNFLDYSLGTIDSIDDRFAKAKIQLIHHVIDSLKGPDAIKMRDDLTVFLFENPIFADDNLIFDFILELYPDFIPCDPSLDKAAIEPAAFDSPLATKFYLRKTISIFELHPADFPKFVKEHGIFIDQMLEHSSKHKIESIAVYAEYLSQLVEESRTPTLSEQ